MSDQLGDAIGRIQRMHNDVRPVITVLQNALNLTIDVIESLHRMGFFGVNKGLDMLLDFLMDGSVIAEFGATVGQFLLAISMFLQCVESAIKLYKRFKESELGQTIIKFLKERLFTLVPRYALTA